MSEPDRELEEPLLVGAENGESPDTPLENDVTALRSPHSGNSSFSGAVANLAITAVGAGMLALPKAYSTVGIILGLVLTATVCCLTYFSSSVIITYAATDGKDSYGALVAGEFGRKGAATLQGAIITHVLGVMIVYLIIIDDMLIGSAPGYHGLLPYFLGPFPGGELPWWLCRWGASLLLLVGVVAPMLYSRDLSIVAKFSKFSVRLLLLLAAVLVSLAGVAVARGLSADVRFLMPEFKGCMHALGSVTSVLAVSALAFTCQFNLVPVHNSLQDNRTGTMLSATKQAIALCALLYTSIALAGYTLYGSATDGDVLKNLTINAVAGIIGRRPAEALITFVVLANTVNLLINFVLKVWAVREAGCELVLGVQARDLTSASYYGITAVLVAFAYLISIVVPSVWFLVSLVGSTACVTFSYVFPGLLLVRRAKSGSGKALGAGAVALAAIMAGVAIYNTLTGNADV